MAAHSQHQPLRLETLKRRADFLRLRNGTRWTTSAFVLSAAPTKSSQNMTGKRPTAVQVTSNCAREVATARFGFTVTKKLGGAVVRNRIRRRLREAVRLVAAGHARAGFDYVLIARRGALKRPFADLIYDLQTALARLHDRASKSHPAGETGRRSGRRKIRAEATPQSTTNRPRN
ncbi:MAG: ribonuclease P protein component [Hyphomicrobiaceae bacterium]